MKWTAFTDVDLLDELVLSVRASERARLGVAVPAGSDEATLFVDVMELRSEVLDRLERKPRGMRWPDALINPN